MTIRDRLTSLEQFGVKLGLENITRMLDALGRPQDVFPSVHVAGTNGKGSVTAMVERALRAGGHRTGRYTSPHLAHLEERFAIDGAPVPAPVLDAALERVFETIDGLRARGTLETLPTFFEATTAAAFEVFRQQGVNAAVIEVGLGGRYDATNVLVPIATAITSIAFDHEKYLGHTLAAIAGEKAGIAKRGVPMVAGALPDEALAAVQRACAETGAPLACAAADTRVEWEMRDGRTWLTLETPVGRYGPLRLSLAGRHQVQNAVVATRLLETCAARGWSVDTRAIVTGLRDAEWPARLEWVPAHGGTLLIDAAHNPAGAAALAAYVADAGLGPLPLVVAMMRDKDVEGMLRAMLPAASAVCATQIDLPRCLPAEDLAHRVRSIAPAGLPVAVEPDPDHAVAMALRGSPRAIVAGSIFLVGPLRARLLA